MLSSDGQKFEWVELFPKGVVVAYMARDISATVKDDMQRNGRVDSLRFELPVGKWFM